MEIITHFLAFMFGGAIGCIGMACVAVGADADRMKKHDRR